MALELYLRDEVTASDVADLSKTLRAWPEESHLAGRQNFRNANSVRNKLYNLEYLDTDGERGRKNAGEVTEEVWKELGRDRPRVVKAAEDVRAALPQAGLKRPRLESGTADFEAEEGGLVMKVHLAKERDARLVREKKAEALARTGKLECEACGFDSDALYGVLGIIDCHHLLAISEMEPGSTTSVSELRLLCPNCHRLVHSQRPCLRWDQLLEKLKASA